MNIRRLLPEKTGCQAVFFVESFLKKNEKRLVTTGITVL
jgi:hypothetical protein